MASTSKERVAFPPDRDTRLGPDRARLAAVLAELWGLICVVYEGFSLGVGGLAGRRARQRERGYLVESPATSPSLSHLPSQRRRAAASTART